MFLNKRYVMVTWKEVFSFFWDDRLWECAIDGERWLVAFIPVLPFFGSFCLKENIEASFHKQGYLSWLVSMGYILGCFRSLCRWRLPNYLTGFWKSYGEVSFDSLYGYARIWRDIEFLWLSEISFLFLPVKNFYIDYFNKK